MDTTAIRLMNWFVKHLPDKPLSVLDVGSMDVNGTYRRSSI